MYAFSDNILTVKLCRYVSINVMKKDLKHESV